MHSALPRSRQGHHLHHHDAHADRLSGICGNGKIHTGGGISSCADSRHQFLGSTGAQALLLMEMARMQKNGKSLNEVITYAEKAREDARIHFMVGDLSYLEIGRTHRQGCYHFRRTFENQAHHHFKGRRNQHRRYLPCQKKRTYTDCIHHRKAFQGNQRKSRTLYRNARHKYHLGRYGQLLCSAAGNGSRHGIPASLPDWRDHLHPHRSGDNRLLLRQEIRILSYIRQKQIKTDIPSGMCAQPVTGCLFLLFI